MLFPVPDQALPLRIKIALTGAFQRLRLHASKARCVLWPETEREKKKRENYPAKSPNLRHHQARLQNKGLSRPSRLWTSPSPTGDRQVRARPRG